jgi:catechol 2,3-dioxygenase-like lactoylglutathione lyase family enzyme
VGIRRLNHAVLYVRDVPRSVEFYTDVLGFRVVHRPTPTAAFLRAAESDNDHDLGLDRKSVV